MKNRGDELKKTFKGSFRMMSKKEAIEMQKKVDDPNNPYFQDYTGYYFSKTFKASHIK